MTIAALEETDARAIDERRRYTSRLQRRAQAHVSSELGRDTYDDGIDRQIAMLIHHAAETTGARRVTFYRQLARGRRWQLVTLLDDGGYYYGLISADFLDIPRAIAGRGTPLTMTPDRPFDGAVAPPGPLPWTNYAGLPLATGGAVSAVLEMIDVADAGMIDQHVRSLETAAAALVEALGRDVRTRQGVDGGSERPAKGISGAMVLDTVLRPPGDTDDLIELQPDEWRLLAQIDGERPLATIAGAAGLAPAQAAGVAARLLKRGLIQHGRSMRRR